jgi:acetoin utilization deacetylase AcuC-like enzyme
MLKIAWSEIYAHPLPENHRFPMIKYNLIPEQLTYEGTVTDDNFFEPVPLEEEYILNTHDETYWHRLKYRLLSRSEIRRTGFPMSEQLIQREITIMQGTLQAALYALEYGVAFNIAGGTHHAFTDRGEGFCLLNDIAIAANYLLEQGHVSKVLVVDLDVHQGNGTAQIFRDKPEVFTFSMHGAKNYPMHKEESDLDIALPDGTEDDAYLTQLTENFYRLLDKVQPDFVLYQSGVDVLKSDKLGRLGMSIAGCRERDRIVLKRCKQYGIPVALSMGGGYARQIAHIVEAHANTYRLAQEIFF